MVEARKLEPRDFQFVEILGRGAYGRVAKAVRKETGETFAVKIIEKAHLKKENKARQALIEKNILAKLRDHPGTVRLHHTFQDTENLYFVLEFCPNGDLLDLINNFEGHFPIELAKFYTAELIEILDLLHQRGVIHRDLKPENLLLSQDFHLKLSDFGTGKELNPDPDGAELSRERRGTFVGTAEYVSPEVLLDQEVGKEADLWALGCMIYQFVNGRPPFQAMNDYLIFELIKESRVNYPDTMPFDAADLVSKLLVLNPKERLGAGNPGEVNDMNALKNHPFIQGIDMERIFVTPIPYDNMPDKSKDSSDDELEVQLLNRDNRDRGVVMTGLVKKKAGWVYKKRQLTITNQPRILYSDIDNNYKGDVPLSAEVRAELRGGKDFAIVTPSRTYLFKEIIGDPQKWVDGINKFIREHFGRH
mmetsp:Transcript_4/g.3  ORF Transcript_4/g.3 Transcript_4/m.3 type:complete len:419 (-) Transcript_4:36-1292(-)